MAVQQGGVVRYSKTTSELMPQVPLIDGQILFISDTAELYIDDGTERKKISCSCEHTDSSAPSISSSAPPDSSATSSAPPVQPITQIPITVPSYANEIIIYGVKNNSFDSSFDAMIKMTNTSIGNYEYLEVSPSTSISSLIGSTIYVTIPESLAVSAICVIFENKEGVKSDADIIPLKDYSISSTSSVSKVKLTTVWRNGTTHLYTDEVDVKTTSVSSLQTIYLRPPNNATDFTLSITGAENGWELINTSTNTFNARVKGVTLVPNGISVIDFTGNSIPTAVAGNLILLHDIGIHQYPSVSIEESLYDRGILSKPMSLYTRADIGSTINIPLQNNLTIPFTIVALNGYKCTDTSIGKTLVLWANEAVSYQQFDGHSVVCEKAGGCRDLGTYYQGGRTQWEVCDLRAWLNNDWLNTLDSTLLAKNIAEVQVPNISNGELYDGGTITKDKAFILSPNELNNKLPFLGWGSQSVAGTCMPYFEDTYKAPLIRAKADIYWTRSWVSRQQIPSSTSGNILNSDSSVMIVDKNSDLKSKFTSNYSNNRITTDHGTQYKWCSGEHIGQFTEERYKCPSTGEYATTTAKDTKAVVPAIVLYDKYS